MRHVYSAKIVTIYINSCGLEIETIPTKQTILLQLLVCLVCPGHAHVYAYKCNITSLFEMLLCFVKSMI